MAEGDTLSRKKEKCLPLVHLVCGYVTWIYSLSVEADVQTKFHSEVGEEFLLGIM